MEDGKLDEPENSVLTKKMKRGTAEKRGSEKDDIIEKSGKQAGGKADWKKRVRQGEL